MRSKEEILESLNFEFIFTIFIIGDHHLYEDTVEITACSYEAAKLILLATCPDIDGFLYNPNPDYLCPAIRH